MFWKKFRPHSRHYHFVAVLEVEVVDSENAVDGQKELRLTLADTTIVKHTVSAKEYDQFASSFLKGGQVLNP